MNIRAIEPRDIEQIRKVHRKFFSNEFSFPDFTKEFLDAFIITDDNDDIVVAGGIKEIAESIIVTNKDLPLKTIYKGLMQTMDISSYLTRRHHFDQLHVFIQDESYMRSLINRGFRPTKGKALVTDV